LWTNRPFGLLQQNTSVWKLVDATSDEFTLENRNRSRSLAIILVLATSFLGLFSQSAVGIAAATHTGSWTGSFSNTWTHNSYSWSHGSNTWTHNGYSWSYTNSWSWTQNQNQHSWSHSQHSWQQATTTVTASAPWHNGGYYNGGYSNGGYYNGGQYNGGYYSGGQYNGGYYNNGQYYAGPAPNQCYPYLYNGCYPSNPSVPYCSTPGYCPNPVGETMQSVSTVTAPPATQVSVSTEMVTVLPSSTDSNVQPAFYNQNYAQPSVDYSWLYVAIGLLAVGVVVFVVGFFASRSRSQPNPTQPRYVQPFAAQSRGSLFCGRCGTPAPQGHVYCSKCGLRLG